MRARGVALVVVLVFRAGEVRAEEAKAPLPPAPSVEQVPSAPAPSASVDPAAAPTPASAPTPAPAPAAPVPAPASPAPVAPGPPARPLPPGYSFVHLGASHERAQLELKSSIDQGEWRAVCLAPCDVPVPVAGALVRVTAPGMTHSNAFRIEPGSGTALVRVDGGSAKARALGITGLFVGIPTAVAGMALFGYGKLEDLRGARIAGTVVLATSAVVLVASLPLLLMGSTKVRDARGSVIAETLRTGQATF